MIAETRSARAAREQAADGTAIWAGGWHVNRAPTSRWPNLELARLWQYREVAAVLAERDIRVRYKQTALGLAWFVLQPLAAAALFSVIFGRLSHFSGDGVPYPVFAYAGLVLWTYVSGSLDLVANSLVQNRDLVTRVYFPRLLVPLAAVIPRLVDLGVSLVVLGVVMAGYGIIPGPALVLLPVWVLASVATVLGAGLWLAALNVQYRDVRHTLPFLMQLWLFASPIVYPPSLVHGGLRYLYAVNPMASIIPGFRWSLVGTPAPGRELIVSLGVALVLLATGLFYFVRYEQRFADVI